MTGDEGDSNDLVLVVRMTAQEGKEDELARRLRELADATRQEPGCELYIPTQDPDNPRSFLFYEQYVDKDALDAHAASEHFQRARRRQAVRR